MKHMKLKIYSQNALDGFSRPETSDEYLRIIRELSPDVALFTEAYKAGTEKAVQPAINQLKAAGYEILHGPYDEQDGRKDRHGILLAVRSSLVSPKKPRLTRIGEHNIVECWLRYKKEQPIHFLGMHLNDRSEAKRQAELNDLLQLIDTHNMPTIISGDLNTIHRSEAKGKTFRTARRIHLLVRLRLHPITHPTGQPMPNNHGRRGSIFYRLHEMASGRTIKRLEENGFTDADPTHQPTLPADSPYAQLDHTLVSRHFTVKDFAVLAAGSSDHRGIITELEV